MFLKKVIQREGKNLIKKNWYAFVAKHFGYFETNCHIEEIAFVQIFSQVASPFSLCGLLFGSQRRELHKAADAQSPSDELIPLTSA